MTKVLSVAILVVLVSLAACDNKTEQTAAVTAPEIQHERQGKVVEFTHAAGYTYALVEKNTGQMWFAGPPAELEVGQTVYWNQGAVMNSFKSKSLGKTFDSIMFIDAYLDQPPAAAPVRAAAPAQPAPKGEVISIETAIGYLYLEIASGSGNVWVAAPMADIKVGDQVEWSGASLMKDFFSKSLDRNFAEIYFAAAVVKVD